METPILARNIVSDTLRNTCTGCTVKISSHFDSDQNIIRRVLGSFFHSEEILPPCRNFLTKDEWSPNTLHRSAASTTMTETRQPRIEAALEQVDAEIAATDAEANAFKTFGKRLRSMEPDHRAKQTSVAVTGSGAAGVTMLASSNRPVDNSLRRVRTAYRETVMAVPHFETDYDDTLAENVATEFGEEVARHVVDGDALMPVLYRALVDAVETARFERTRFLGLLRTERESLVSTAHELNEIEGCALQLADRLSSPEPDVSPDAFDAEIRELRERCESLLEARQQTIHDRFVPALSGVERQSLTRYLYSSSETRFPALSDIACCLETVDAQKQSARRRT